MTLRSITYFRYMESREESELRVVLRRNSAVVAYAMTYKASGPKSRTRQTYAVLRSGGTIWRGAA